MDSLFVEYTAGNIKLTRCKCGSVADKYVEYENILIAIDIILLRKAAYRHVLYNEHQFEVAKVSIL